MLFYKLYTPEVILHATGEFTSSYYNTQKLPIPLVQIVQPIDDFLKYH